MIFKEKRQIIGEIILCPCLGFFCFIFLGSIIINRFFLPLV